LKIGKKDKKRENKIMQRNLLFRELWIKLRDGLSNFD
jgi:hypothetical protein